jgi:hypothetical protein
MPAEAGIHATGRGDDAESSFGPYACRGGGAMGLLPKICSKRRA